MVVQAAGLGGRLLTFSCPAPGQLGASGAVLGEAGAPAMLLHFWAQQAMNERLYTGLALCIPWTGSGARSLEARAVWGAGLALRGKRRLEEPAELGCDSKARQPFP